MAGIIKRKHGEQEESDTAADASNKTRKLKRERTKGVDVRNVVHSKRKRKDSEKMKDSEDKPKKTSTTKAKEPVDSAKDMRGFLLKRGVDVRDKAPLKKLDKKNVDTYEDDIADEEQPFSKKPRLTKPKAGSKPRAKSNGKKTSQPSTSNATENHSSSTSTALQNRSPSVEVEEINDPEETPQQVLERKRKGWKSSLYGIYKDLFVSINDGRPVQNFPCAFCSYVHKRYQDTGDCNSTKGLKDHAEKCLGIEQTKKVMNSGKKPSEVKEMLHEHQAAGNKNILEMFDGLRKAGIVSYSNIEHTPSQTRAECVRWVTESCRPFEIVADRGFLKLMKQGRPHHWIPHPTTVSRDVKKALVRTRQRVSKSLREYDGDINFATDAWTSQNHGAYVAITAHIIYEGERMSLLLDFFEVAKSHTGKTLAQEFARVLREFGIEEKVLCITGDNATNNDKMFEELMDLLPDFPGKEHQVRCFAHTTNLASKSFLQLFDSKPANPDAKERKELIALLERLEAGEDIEELEAEDQAAVREEAEKVREEMMKEIGLKPLPKATVIEADDNDEGLVDAREDLSPEEETSLETEAAPIREALGKIRALAYKIIHSSTRLLPAWRQLLRKLQLPNRLIPRDVRTRWNSTYDMLKFALEYKAAIKEFTADSDNDVRDFELKKEDWGMLHEFVEALSILKDATLWFSSSEATVADVIPAMDRIDEFLTTAIFEIPEGPENHAATLDLSCFLKFSLACAKKTLNKYYALTDASEAYRIAMVLHPEHKLSYFHSQNWEEPWIKRAHDLVKKIYREKYHDRLDLIDKYGKTDKAESGGNNLKMAGNIFATCSAPAKPAERSELDRFLSSNTELVDDVIQWWLDHRSSFPRLSRMALDYLSIPATTVDVERTFSRARRVVTWERNRLSAQSTRAIMCVGDWSLSHLVYDEDLNAITENGKEPVSKEEQDLVDVDLPDDFDRIIIPRAVKGKRKDMGEMSWDEIEEDCKDKTGRDDSADEDEDEEEEEEEGDDVGGDTEVESGDEDDEDET